MVLIDKPEVGQTDEALLAEELAKIYSTPTPKRWPEPKKVSNLYLIDYVSFYNSWGSNIYTRSLDMNPTRTWLITIFVIDENIPNLR